MTDEHWPTLEEIEARDAGRIDEQHVNAYRKRLRAAQRAYQLAEIRKALGLTQTDVAEAMHVSQRRVSAVERGDISRTELGTVASYVQALGGRIEVVADFGGRRVVIQLRGHAGDREEVLAQAEGRRLVLEQPKRGQDLFAAPVVIEPLPQVGQHELHDPARAGQLLQP
jgi:transcriptional regulator with XRE-family HTH domain